MRIAPLHNVILNYLFNTFGFNFAIFIALLLAGSNGVMGSVAMGFLSHAISVQFAELGKVLNTRVKHKNTRGAT